MESNPHLVPPLPQFSELAEILQVEATCGSPLELGYRDEGVDGEAFEHSAGGVLLQRPFSINKVGPASFFVEDVAELEAFYLEHLGLTRTEEVVFKGHRCVFLRSAAEHHTIALFPLALRETLGFNPGTRLMSWGVEVSSYRQLRDARDYLRKRNVQIVDVPAELYPGIDYAFHVRDPSGHHVMLYYYMEQIGWQGIPRPREARRAVSAEWPEILPPLSDTYMDQVRQGPLA
jgi:catechol 2,3-dioxygenase-like lactoylglutathione lyase family enzyme